MCDTSCDVCIGDCDDSCPGSCDEGCNPTCDNACAATQLTCLHTCIYCPTPGIQNNPPATFSLSNGNGYGSVATFSCPQGFSLSSQQTRTCQYPSETWSDYAPVCNALQCQAPPVVQHSRYTPTTGLYYSLAPNLRFINWTCLQGFYMTGPNASFCNPDLSWTTAPQCLDIDECARNPQPCIGGNCSNTVGGYLCSCPPGYTLTGDTCYGNTCAPLPTPGPSGAFIRFNETYWYNQSLQLSTFTNRSSGSYSCKFQCRATLYCPFGYQPDPSIAAGGGLVCDPPVTQGGPVNWNFVSKGQTVGCPGVPCPASRPPVGPFVNGTVVYPLQGGGVPKNPLRYLDVVTIACNLGYQPVGPAEWDCGNNAWTCLDMNNNPTPCTQPAECVGKLCDPTPTVPNGYALPAARQYYPATITYGCNPGYMNVATNGSTGICDAASMQWKQGVPFCVGIPCNTPPLSGTVNPPTVTNLQTYPSNATYTCIPNYYYFPNRTTSCDTTGNYPAAPNCQYRIINPPPSLTSTTAITVLTIGGQYGGGTAISATYGPVGQETMYTCTSPQFLSPIQFRCNAPAGTGANMMLVIKSNDLNNVLTFTRLGLNYTRPVILSVTGYTSSNVSLQNGTILKSDTRFGMDVITIRGQHFGLDPSNLHVYYGLKYTCAIITAACTDTLNCTIICTTSRGAGSFLPFRVGAGPTMATMGWSANSATNFSYPDGPTVSAVSGCSPDPNLGAATINCPTNGGLNLTLIGRVFVDPEANTTKPIVTIGSNQCPLIANNVSYIICNLLAGTGLSQTVAVMVGDLAGDAQPLLSYAAPNVTNVLACTNRVDCPRSGGAIVSVIGSNFGSLLAKIIIGGTLCNNVTHQNYNTLTCIMPVGKGLTHILSVLQYNGQYVTTNFTLSYAVCAAGKYDSPGNNTVCNNCQAGKYTEIPNRDFCDVCALGRFQPFVGKSFCQSASYGQYVNTTGAVGVQTCLAGTYGPQTEGQGCTNCEPGRYGPNPGMGTCNLCDYGNYQPFAGQNTCLQCPTGSFQNSLGMANCNQCVRGKVANVSQSSQCLSCAVGQYSNDFVSCNACLNGYYTDRAAASVCDPCSAGRFGVGSGVSYCQACSAGSYQNNFSATNCGQCLPGTWQQSTSSSSCDKCLPGYFSNTSSATICQYCAAGKYAPAQQSVGCIDCDIGTYARDIRSSYCLSCEPGSFNPGTAASICGFCGLGYIAAGYRATICDACLPGAFSSAIGGKNCLLCDYGTANPNLASSFCGTCIPGQYAGVVAATVCSACDAGRFSAGSRSASCEPCPGGKITASPGLSVCSICGTGSVASLAGSTICDQCDAGRYSALSGSTVCASCIPGTFTNTSGAIICLDCPAGTISPAQRQTACEACVEGLYTLAPRSTVCARCFPGKFSNITQATACQDCGPGSYTELPGSTFCDECERGSYSNLPSSSTCILCTPGRYTPDSLAITCLSCSPGTYQNNQGRSFCENCTIGQFLASAGGSACVRCPRGRYQNIPRQVDCVDCGQGYYTDQLGTTQCTSCDFGKYAVSATASVCQLCDPGRFQNKTAQTGCIPCDPGTIGAQYGLSNCSKCALGSFAAGVGNSACTACPPGQFGNKTGAFACLDCASGYFSEVPSSQFCTACDPGTFTKVVRATNCTVCAQGKYQPSAGQTDCLTCPAGRYGPNERLVDCHPCAAGKFRDSPGAENCLPCDVGDHANVTGLSSCLACPPGTFASSIGTANCTNCALGRYTEKTRSLLCEACVPGTYTDTEGSPTCSNCPIGTYQGLRGATCCIDCLPGKFSRVAYSECPACPAQTANPWFGMGICYRCANEAHTSELGDSCICPRGTFAPTREKNMTLFTCTTCNIGFDCTEEGVRFATLKVRPGWWRANEDVLVAQPCIILAHCLGGHNATCGTHRDGVLCAFCETGYTASGTGKTGVCSECPESMGGAYAVIVLASLGALAAIFLIYYIVLISDRDLVATVKRNRLQELGGDPVNMETNSGSTGGTGDSGSMDSTRESATRESDSSQLGEKSSMASLDSPTPDQPVKDKKSGVTAGATGAETRIRPNVVYKMKIVAGFLQILTNLTLSVTMPWPTHFRDFMLIFSFLNLDFLPWGTVGCVASLEYIDKILIISSLPMIALVIGGGAVLVIYLTSRGVDRAVTIRIWTLRVFKLFAWTLFLLYPFLCATILKYYVCRRIDDQIFLVADFNVQCYSDKWYKSLPIAVIATLVYPFGIPAAFGTFLLINRRKLDNLEMRLKLGFLVDAYHRSTWWFELVWSVNKMFCVSIIAFFPTDWQMPVGMVWLVSFVIVLLLTRPYIRKGEDRLALLCMLEIILLLQFCLVLVSYNGQIDDKTDWLLSVGMIAMVIMALLVALAIAIKNGYKILRRWHTAWKRKKGKTNKPTLGGSTSLVQERLEKNSTLVEGRRPDSTGTASNTFEKDLAKFNFTATW